jgi:hypothetical protein
MINKPGPVIHFLLANQKVDHPERIYWKKVSCIFGALVLLREKLANHIWF